MGEIATKVLVAVAVAIAGGIVGIIFGKAGILDKFLHKKKDKKKKEKEQEEQKKEQALINQIGEVVNTKFEENLTPIKKELDAVKKDINGIKEDLVIMKEGDKASLKNQLLTCYYRCEAKGFKTVDDSENYRVLLDAYHKIKGNSFIDKDITPSFDKIPLKSAAFKSGKKIKKQLPKK